LTLTLTLTIFSSKNTQVKRAPISVITAVVMVTTVAVVANLSSIEREGGDQRLLIPSQILCEGEGAQ